MEKIVKPKTHRGRRALQARAPKTHENTKTAMFIKGGKTSETVSQALKDMYALKNPNATMYKRRNIFRPFEDQTSLEFFSQKADASLFLFGCHSKKRPNDLIFGRMYDYHLLDMIELGIEKLKPIHNFEGSKCALGTKPCLLFAGEPFENDPDYKRLKCLLIDFFRGPVVTNIRLAGLEHVLAFTAIDGKLFLRSYKILMKKSGVKTPRVELLEMGPSMDLVVRRTRLASDDLYKKALRQPKEAKPKKTKNVTKDVFGTRLGRIHMEKQDLTKLQTRKLKGLKRKATKETSEVPDKVTKEAAKEDANDDQSDE